MPQVASLSDTRGVLRLAGNDVFTFLQGLLTNDVTQLEAEDSKPMYAAVLTAQGRYLHDMFLNREKGEQNSLLADVDKSGLPHLLQLLKRYKLRSKVDIEDVSDRFTIWARFGAGRQQADIWPSDPRLEQLGQRLILGAKDKPPSVEGEPETEGIEYKGWRIEHGIAEGDTEIPSSHAVPLEYNLDGLHAISFSKGCYVGQELIARSHYRGVVRKRVMPIELEAGHQAEVGAAVIGEESAKRPVGHIVSLHGGRGLAHLRLQPALQAAEGQIQLHVEGSGIKVTPWRPTWWPQHWGKEDEAQ